MGTEDMNNIFNKKNITEEVNMNSETKKEQADLFRQRFDEIKRTVPEEALVLLNEAINNELIDPSFEGDHKQDELMHTFADNSNWEKVEEIIKQTVKPDSQKGRILWYELNSGQSYDGPRVEEKKAENYSPEEIEKHEVKDYDSCMDAIRMEKFEDVEEYVQSLRNKNQIDTADHLTRELMNKHIEKEDYASTKRIVIELTDKPGSIEGRKKHLENLTGKSFEEI